MYKSPIEIIQQQAQIKMENDIYRAVLSYDINVDKDELVKALQYNRDKYEKGYADAMASIVRCKDCIHYTPVEGGKPFCEWHITAVAGDDFCSFGERKGDGDA